MRGAKRSWKSDIILFVILIAMPLLALARTSSIRELLLSLPAIAGIGLLALWLYQRGPFGRAAALLLKAAETAGSMLVFITLGPLDADLFGRLEGRTADFLSTVSPGLIAAAAVATLVVLAVCYACLQGIALKTNAWHALAGALLLLTLLGSARYVLPLHAASASSLAIPAADMERIAPDERIAFNLSDDLVLLHLESLNSRVANGGALVDGVRYDRPMAPVLLSHAKEGLYFPEFYGNSMMTVRGQESTLCGVNDNLAAPYSMRHGEYDFKCLPQLFKENGFETYYFYANPVRYHGSTEFMKKIGFAHLLGPEIMQPGDERYDWGYRDDVFYARVFEYLAKQPPGKKLVYIEVSGLHHWPFEEHQAFTLNHTYARPRSFYERFANSLSQQDAALGSFFDVVEAQRNISQVFLFGDHGWPSGINGDRYTHTNMHDDTYLAAMLYLPPQGIPSATIKTRYDQASLFHTILELYATNYSSRWSIPEITPNAENRAPRVIRLSQPYGDRYAGIVAYPDKWVYNLRTGITMRYDLANDPYEQHGEIADAPPYIGKPIDIIAPEFPARFGDDGAAGWKMALRSWDIPGLPAAEDLRHSFRTENATRGRVLAITAAGVSAPHRIFLNGRELNTTLCLSEEKAECRIPLGEGLLEAGENTIVILNSEDPGTISKDDYIVYGIALLDEAE